MRLEPVPTIARERRVPFLTVHGTAEEELLRTYDYVEEEFLLTGRAHRYRWARNGERVIADSDQSYTTRLLLRRPRRPAGFSGVVHLELLNPTRGHDIAITWDYAARYLCRTGATWAGLTCKPSAAATLRTIDPARYPRVAIPHDGQAWEIVAAAARLLRAAEGGPLAGPSPARRLYLSGWSMTGAYLQTFLGEGFHAALRLDGGRPVVDGYLVGVSTGGFAPGYCSVETPFPGEVRSLDGLLPFGDRRRILGPADVPVVQFLSQDDAAMHLGARRPDSDDPGDRYRCYEVPGRGHGGQPAPATQAAVMKAAQALDSPAPAASPGTDFPSAPLVNAVLANLHAWADEGVSPPAADPLVLDPLPADAAPLVARPAAPRCDSLGHALGGLRTPNLDVPSARYRGAAEPGARRPSARTWTATPMDATELRERYGSVDAFAARRRRRIDEMVRDRWFLPEDAAGQHRALDAQLRALRAL